MGYCNSRLRFKMLKELFDNRQLSGEGDSYIIKVTK